MRSSIAERALGIVVTALLLLGPGACRDDKPARPLPSGAGRRRQHRRARRHGRRPRRHRRHAAAPADRRPPAAAAGAGAGGCARR